MTSDKQTASQFRAHPAVSQGTARRVRKTLSLRPDVITEIEKIANEKDKSFSNLGEEALIQYLENYNRKGNQ